MFGNFGIDDEEERKKMWLDQLTGGVGMQQANPEMGSYRGKAIEGYDPGLMDRANALQGQVTQAMVDSNMRAPQNQAEVARLAALPLAYSSIGSVKNGSNWDGFTKPIIDAVNDKYDTYDANARTVLASQDKMNDKVDDYVKNSRDYAIAEEGQNYARGRDAKGDAERAADRAAQRERQALEDKRKLEDRDYERQRDLIEDGRNAKKFDMETQREERLMTREEREAKRFETTLEREDRKYAREDEKAAKEAEKEAKGTIETYGMAGDRVVYKQEKAGNTRFVYSDGTEATSSDLSTIKKIGEKGTSSNNTQIITREDGTYLVDKTDGSAKKIENVPGKTTGGASKPEKFTEGQTKDINFATRAKAANSVIENKEEDFQGAGGVWGRAVNDYAPTAVQGYLTPDKYAQAEQGASEFIAAVLRKDSGAAIPEVEFNREYKKYFPLPGEGAEQIAQKRAARERAVRALEAGMTPEMLDRVDGASGIQRDNGQSQTRQGSYPTVTQKAMEKLRSNPDRAEEFDQLYGPGSARRVLGGQL